MYPNWQGGIIKDYNGRIQRCIGNGKYIQESVYQYLKDNEMKSVSKGFIIHHKDFNKLNNHINN